MRLQGTDGVRGIVKKNLDLKSSRSPIQIYLESGILTGEFFEAYCFGLSQYLLKAGKVKLDGEIAIGWDPRDMDGECTGNAVTGIRKAGLNARVLGIVPTPLVPLFMSAWGLQAGIAITASHNPADQNGIKIFLTPLGLKPLPEEEEEISSLIIALDPANLRATKETGKYVDSREEARRLALEFHVDPCNSWLPEGRSLPSLRLLIDSSNGACSGLAVDIFRAAGFSEVHEYNLRPEDGINENCGVVGLENCSTIKADSLGVLSKNSFITGLFETGRQERSMPAKERKICIGVVFDGDGDRFHLLICNPERDEIHVLSGDEAAIHQALFLLKSNPGKWKGALYVNTVESDIQCSLEAARAGLALEKTGVGDKWLLRKAAELQERFAVGSERSGHLITAGYLTNCKKEKVSVFVGNGIKGTLNALASIFFLHPRPEEEGWLEKVVHPFPVGFNKILYAYYTDKAKWHRNSEAWKKALSLVGERISGYFGEGVHLREKPFLEEPGLLYFEIMDLKGCLKASIHIRNSGTEDKTGITIKGSKEDCALLSRLGKEALKLLVAEIKNPDHPFCKAQKRLISLLYPDNVLAREGLPEDLLESGSLDRLLREVGEKEGMLESSEGGYRLSQFGKWYFTKIV